ncbi:MAG: AAA family ATPase, partial [Oscillospiraceae bacterium]|nr:AAA family ATPase [Oscillospiraceae bacterium]
MRKGFACLFYGSPGTGKTETVNQLARMTGRDVLMVDVSQIKSNWAFTTRSSTRSSKTSAGLRKSCSGRRRNGAQRQILRDPGRASWIRTTRSSRD